VNLESIKQKLFAIQNQQQSRRKSSQDQTHSNYDQKTTNHKEDQLQQYYTERNSSQEPTPLLFNETPSQFYTIDSVPEQR